MLRQLAEAAIARGGVPVALAVAGARSLPPEVQIAFYRIAQEALNNVVRHAHASHVELSLRSEAHRVELRIADNGRGFNLSTVQPAHLGLGIMRERAEAIAARLSIVSSPGRGSRVAVEWEET